MPSLTRDSRGRSPYWICCYTRLALGFSVLHRVADVRVGGYAVEVLRGKLTLEAS